jgi:hypothetical protein
MITKINMFSQAQRRSVIIEEEQEDSLFESTWLSNMIEEIDKKMIWEFEMATLERVPPP